MDAISNYTLFLLSGIILNITPGSDTIYILSRSIAQGRMAGFFSVLGINTGVLFHTILVASGLSLVISNSVVLFHLIKYAGAAYLIYLGATTIFKKKSITDTHGAEIKSRKNNREIYTQGLLTNILNPKIILFFLTFLPQFIIPGKGSAAMGLVILGSTLVVTSTIWSLLLVYFSAFFTSKARNNPKVSKWLNTLSGMVFLGLGLNVAVSK